MTIDDLRRDLSVRIRAAAEDVHTAAVAEADAEDQQAILDMLGHGDPVTVRQLGENPAYAHATTLLLVRLAKLATLVEIGETYLSPADLAAAIRRCQSWRAAILDDMIRRGW